MLTYVTPPGWFAIASSDLHLLLSDHLHCERKAAENALSLVRRYPHAHGRTVVLTRLAHEETSHMVQVAGLIEVRGWRPRSDAPNQYARGLNALVRSEEPGRLVDELLVGALIEARSHERLGLLADGFGRTDERELADFYAALCDAEERHAAIFLDLARPLLPDGEVDARFAQMVAREAAILADLPHGPRIH